MIDWLIEFLEETIRWFREKIQELEERKAVLRRAREGWTDPEHPLRPQEKRPVGDTEKKYIDDAIKAADALIDGYKKQIKTLQDDIDELKQDVRP